MFYGPGEVTGFFFGLSQFGRHSTYGHGQHQESSGTIVNFIPARPSRYHVLGFRYQDLRFRYSVLRFRYRVLF